MRDWTKPIRQAYYNALMGNVIIESAPVPVFQEKVPDHAPNMCYIIIADTQGAQANDFTTWNTDATVNIDIVNLFNAESGDYVDDMADQVKQILLPTRTTKGIVDPTGFQVIMMMVDGEQDIPIAQTGTGFIKRKILRMRQTIVDNN